jgi:hypothetical protein
MDGRGFTHGETPRKAWLSLEIPGYTQTLLANFHVFPCISFHTHTWLFYAILMYFISLTYFQTLTFREPAWEYGG